MTVLTDLVERHGLLLGRLVSVQADVLPLSVVDRMAEQWPIVAALMVGLWLVFKAYQTLVDKVIAVVSANTQAFTANTEATNKLRASVETMNERFELLARRVDAMEGDRQMGRPRT